ncbi:hypothetical protein scyTo_0010657 [Scyliorhinus torazame]|uniref:Uncharacterized protein n=1 Tax=Scyliorhinus torazame TaxID=75743 RepID=A0A401P9T3_SCYTO|nr:hypothetical protein [Scyliorhinus torazame]
MAARACALVTLFHGRPKLKDSLKRESTRENLQTPNPSSQTLLRKELIPCPDAGSRLHVESLPGGHTWCWDRAGIHAEVTLEADRQVRARSSVTMVQTDLI